MQSGLWRKKSNLAPLAKLCAAHPDSRSQCVEHTVGMLMMHPHRVGGQDVYNDN